MGRRRIGSFVGGSGVGGGGALAKKGQKVQIPPTNRRLKVEVQPPTLFGWVEMAVGNWDPRALSKLIFRTSL